MNVNSLRPSTELRCPLCDARSVPRFCKESFWVHRCDACGHFFAAPSDSQKHVDNQYGDQYFFGGGAGYDDYFSERRLLIERGRLYARLLARHTKRGTILDVGCAAGFLLRGYAEEGWQATGIEPNERMANYGRAEMGLDIITTTLEAYRPDRGFDVVSAVQVLPHFIDPRSALRSFAAYLVDGGWCLIETWRRDSLAAKLFGRFWHEFSPPTVLHWFTRRSLIELMDDCGFVIRASGRPSKWLNAGHAASLISYKLQQSVAGRVTRPLLSLVPKQLVLPYPGDDLMWLLFQKR